MKRERNGNENGVSTISASMSTNLLLSLFYSWGQGTCYTRDVFNIFSDVRHWWNQVLSEPQFIWLAQCFPNLKSSGCCTYISLILSHFIHPLINSAIYAVPFRDLPHFKYILLLFVFLHLFYDYNKMITILNSYQ